MKKLLAMIVLSLCFMLPSKAENIKDFQIEGISIGESLLNYYSESEIKKNKQELYFKDTTYSQSEWLEIESEAYSNLSIAHKTNDKKYKIVHISGVNFMDFEECKKQMIKVDDELKTMFSSFRRTEENRKHEYDKTGNSFGEVITYWAKNNDSINISCINWSDKITKKNNWGDNLSISITKIEFLKWQLNDANR
jgi:hypothetical protein